jgi:hypothetical protein
MTLIGKDIPGNLLAENSRSFVLFSKMLETRLNKTSQRLVKAQQKSKYSSEEFMTWSARTLYYMSKMTTSKRNMMP